MRKFLQLVTFLIFFISSFFISPLAHAQVSGLVSYWSADGTANDSVSNNNGTLKGGATYAEGIRNQAFNLNGIDGYVDIPTSTNVNPTGSFAITAWIYPTADVLSRITDKWGDMNEWSNQRAYTFGTQPGGVLEFAIASATDQANTAYVISSPTGTIAINQWNFVSAVYDQASGAESLYVNGNLVAQRVNPPITVMQSIADLSIGARLRAPGSFAYPFQGKIDEIKFFNIALSSSDLTNVMGLPIINSISDTIVNVGNVYSKNGTFTDPDSTSTSWTATVDYGDGSRMSILPLSGKNFTLNHTFVSGGIYTVKVKVTNNYGMTGIMTTKVTVIGLASYWTGDNTTSDSVGSNNGILQGGVTYTQGVVNQAFNFNGINGYVDVPNATNINPTGSFTITAWVYPTVDALSRVLEKWGDYGVWDNQRAYTIGIEQGGILDFAIASATDQANAAYIITSQAGVIQLNKWNFISATYDQSAGTQSLYLNGNLVAQRINPPITVMQSIADLSIGGRLRAPGYFTFPFQGRIDEAKFFFNTALTQTQVQQLMNSIAPVISQITASINPVQVNSPTVVSAVFTDPNTQNTHTATWNWGDGNITTGTIVEPNGLTSGSVSDSHTYLSAGVYPVILTLTNNEGVSTSATYQYLSVYNPTSQGLFSAGNKFNSPAGAYIQNTSLTGDVKFGLSYKYQGTVPTGNRQFSMDFNVANLHVNATSINTFVIANGIGTLTGTGTINGGAQIYNFLVTGSESANTIRIQIKDSSGNTLYDTQPGAADTSTPTTVVTGNILAH